MISFRKSLVLALCIIPIYAGAASAKPSTPADKLTRAVGSIAISHPKKLSLQAVSIDSSGAMRQRPVHINSPAEEKALCNGVMEPGTVRIIPPEYYERPFNILGILALTLGHVVGIYYLIKTARLTVKTPGKILSGTAKGLTFISVGLLTPGLLHWAFTAASDAALFN